MVDEPGEPGEPSGAEDEPSEAPSDSKREQASKPPARRRWWWWLLSVTTVLYGLGAVAAVVMVFVYVDDWWVATLLGYLPRWPTLLPLIVLLPATLLSRRYVLATALTVTGLVLGGPFLGFSTKIRAPGFDDSAPTVRVVTFNMANQPLQGDWLDRWTGELQPDVLAMQECRDHLLPDLPERYELLQAGDFCLASRYPAKLVDQGWLTDAHDSGYIALFEVELSAGPLAVFVVHLRTVRPGIEALMYERFDGLDDMAENTRLRDRESELARAWVDRHREARPTAHAIVVGDFNLIGQSRIFRDHWGDFSDAWRCGLGYGDTKHTRWHGVRIDHVIMAEPVRCEFATVGESIGSDHSSVVVDLRLESGS